MANIPTFNAQPIISQEHERIHSNRGWTITHKHVDVANEAHADIALTTGANCYPHLRKFVVSATGGPCDALLYEGASVSGGTPIAIQNNSRPNSGDSSGVTAVHAPTVSDTGDEIDYALLPTSTAIGANTGGVTGNDIGEEWILEPNKTYLLRLTNNSGGAVTTGWHIFFYKED